MNTSSTPSEGQRDSITPSRLAAIFAATFVIAFGLCSASAIGVADDHPKLGARLIWTSVTIEAICLIGLVTVGIIALVRSIHRG